MTIAPKEVVGHLKLKPRQDINLGIETDVDTDIHIGINIKVVIHLCFDVTVDSTARHSERQLLVLFTAGGCHFFIFWNRRAIVRFPEVPLRARTERKVASTAIGAPSEQRT